MDEELQEALDRQELEDEQRWREAQYEHEQYEIEAMNELYGEGGW